jgi:hypothetical protein
MNLIMTAKQCAASTSSSWREGVRRAFARIGSGSQAWRLSTVSAGLLAPCCAYVGIAV